MERARSLTTEQSKLLRQNTLELRSALQDASVYRDRRSISRLVQLALTGEVARLFARFLVCCFYLNMVYSEVETWSHMHTVEAQEKMIRWREPGQVIKPLPFPVFYAAVVLPSAILTALGVLPWLFGVLLLGVVVWRDARLMWVMLYNVIMHKGQPPELLMKQLAMIGSTLLVVALSVRESKSLNRAATGLLQSDTPRRQRLGVKKSTAVLLGRLLMAALLLGAGYKQFFRVYERWSGSSAEPVSQHYGRRDARDNNWLLLECALALPLALGLWTTPVSLLLACTLLGEAALHWQWQWWGSDMPTWHYRQNIRDHFFVNTAVAGGLALMQSFGGGVLSVDELLQKKK